MYTLSVVVGIVFSDFFRGQELSKLALDGVDHVISFTAAEGHVYFRVFQ